jgi:TolA-binding protein
LTTEEESPLNELPVEYQFPSYATVAAASTLSSETTQVSSPTTSTFPDWQREKQELESQIRQQASQIEQIQADLQDRITRSQDLEERLARALDLAHTRDLRHEEMMTKLEQLMLRHTQIIPSETLINPSTPARPPKPATSPPTKRPNTNPSPNRDVYAMFRQTTGRNHPPRHLTAVSPQEMETDDDLMPPPPGVKSGRKIE